MIDTSESLLSGRLKAEGAQGAWMEIYTLYWGAILRYAGRTGLAAPQAEEVLQETMVAIMRSDPDFTNQLGNDSCRQTLPAMVHAKSLEVERRGRANSETSFQPSDCSAGARGIAGLPTLSPEALQQWREVIVEEVLARLREDPTLGENTFAIFQAYVLKDRSAALVARRFGVKENAVYQIKNRLLRRIEASVDGLLPTKGSSTGTVRHASVAAIWKDATQYGRTASSAAPSRAGEPTSATPPVSATATHREPLGG